MTPIFRANNMDQNITADTVWQRAIGQLDAECARQLTIRAKDVLNAPTYHRPPIDNVVVALLDRPGPLTALVSWSDALGGKYGEQTWRLASAKHTGICVLSGNKIEVGDAIYRPKKAGPTLVNANAMMLATIVQRASIDECGALSM